MEPEAKLVDCCETGFNYIGWHGCSDSDGHFFIFATDEVTERATLVDICYCPFCGQKLEKRQVIK